MTLNASHQHVPEDVLYQIMMHADATSLSYLCNINHMARHLCQQNIWQQKFTDAQLPSYNHIYTIDEYLKMMNINVEAGQLMKVLKANAYRNIRAIKVIYPNQQTSHFYLVFNPTYVEIVLYKNMTYPEFQAWLMRLLYDDVDIRDNNDIDTSFRKKHLTNQLYKNHVAQLRYKSYNKMNK